MPETPVLRVGPLEVAGRRQPPPHQDRRREAIRAISYIVRDRNWGTYNPEITQPEDRAGRRRFRVGYQAVCKDDSRPSPTRAQIEGDAYGNLVSLPRARRSATSSPTAPASSSCIRSPASAAPPVEVEHVDGSVEQSRFPELIDPTCPFMDLRALTHEAFPGVRVACRMEGDTFEMEDQRNWLDASYKTYVRPLALPWPYTTDQGRAVHAEASRSRSPASLPGRLAADGERRRSPSRSVARGRTMPAVGLAVAGRTAAAGAGAGGAAATLGPALLVAEFDARKGHDAGLAQDYGELARQLGADLVLEVVLPCVDADGQAHRRSRRCCAATWTT